MEDLVIIRLNVERYQSLLNLPLTEMQRRAVRKLLAEHLKQLPMPLQNAEGSAIEESWWYPFLQIP